MHMIKRSHTYISLRYYDCFNKSQYILIFIILFYLFNFWLSQDATDCKVDISISTNFFFTIYEGIFVVPHNGF
jgi:hypothetical protein